MRPLDALQAGTRNGAELLGLDDTGVIEVGKVADLVVCAGDATSDVALLGDRANIRTVVQAGRVVYE
jgi:imidazolonepropionase-like amidohydrolase